MNVNECLYCLSPIVESDTVIRCDSCGASYHGECWDENGGCCAKDCNEGRRHIDVEVEDEGAQKLVLSRESVESAPLRRAINQSNPCIKCGRQVAIGELYCSECVPGPEETQDSRNVGPVLVMLGVLCIVLAWLIVTIVAPRLDISKTNEQPPVSTGVNH